MIATDLLPADRIDKAGRPFRVRQFRPEDRTELEMMYRAFAPKRAAQGLPPEGEEGIRRWLDTVLGDDWHLVVEVEGFLLGHAMLLRIDERSLELANFLHQSIRDRGIGTELNRICVDLGRELGFERIWLCVEPTNRRAIRSYEKATFRMIEDTMFQPELEMEAYTRKDDDGAV